VCFECDREVLLGIDLWEILEFGGLGHVVPGLVLRGRRGHGIRWSVSGKRVLSRARRMVYAPGVLASDIKVRSSWCSTRVRGGGSGNGVAGSAVGLVAVVRVMEAKGGRWSAADWG
jgi:hypothetical protein